MKNNIILCIAVLICSAHSMFGLQSAIPQLNNNAIFAVNVTFTCGAKQATAILTPNTTFQLIITGCPGSALPTISIQSPKGQLSSGNQQLNLFNRISFDASYGLQFFSNTIDQIAGTAQQILLDSEVKNLPINLQ